MATLAMLKQALEISASNFRPKNPDQWVADMSATWIRHPLIAAASDAAVESAIIEHMGASQYAPKLADILTILRSHGARGANSAPSTGPACPDCGGTGWAEGSTRLNSGAIEGPWALVCGCQPRKGVHWADWERSVKGRPDVDRYWITGRNMPSLPDEARLTAAQLQERAERQARRGQVLEFSRRPVDPHAAERERAEKQAKAEGWR